MHRLRANSHAIVVALQRNLLVAAPRQQFRIYSELLRPIPRHSASDREYPHPFCGQHGIREFLDELARAAGTERYALLRVFSKELGVTPHVYQVQLRMARDCRLIKQGWPLA